MIVSEACRIIYRCNVGLPTGVMTGLPVKTLNFQFLWEKALRDNPTAVDCSGVRDNLHRFDFEKVQRV